MCGSKPEMCWSVLALFSRRENSVLKKNTKTHFALARCDFSGTVFPVKHYICWPNFSLLVAVIFFSLRWEGCHGFSPIINSPKEGGSQRIQLTLWQIVLQFSIMHSPGSYYEHCGGWKQSTHRQAMVAEVTAWMFNTLTFPCSPCLALSNSNLISDDWLYVMGQCQWVVMQKFF